MIDRAARIKSEWRVAIIICISLGFLALIPALINYGTFWPWVPFSSVAIWFIAWVLYRVGKQVTGKPLRRPRIR